MAENDKIHYYRPPKITNRSTNSFAIVLHHGDYKGSQWLTKKFIIEVVVGYGGKLLHTWRVRSRDCAFGGRGRRPGCDDGSNVTVRTRQTALRSDVALPIYRRLTVDVGRRWLLLMLSTENMSFDIGAMLQFHF